MAKNSADRRDKGTGSLRKRVRADGTVTFQLKAVVRHQVYVRTVEAETKTAAKSLLRGFLAEIETGSFARQQAEAAALSAQPTLGEWTEIYLTEFMRVENGEYDSTRQTYSAAFKHLPAELRDTKLAEIAEPALHNWLRGLRARGLSVNTIRLIRAAVSSCLGKAVDRKLIQANPTPKFSRLNIGEGESASSRVKRTALSRGQIALLLSKIEDPGAHLWVRVMAGTALRPGEAAALTWGDIDFAQRTISVRHSVKPSTVRGQGTLGCTKNQSSIRDVPMGPGLATALQEARREQEVLMRHLLGLAPGVAPLRPLIEPDMCLFPADLATRETRTVPRPLGSLRKRFKAAAVAAGLPASTVPHAMRHSSLTAVLAGDKDRPGVSAADAARLAGHSKVSTTLDVYAHAVSANLTRGAELADALIEPTTPATVETFPRTKEGQ